EIAVHDRLLSGRAGLGYDIADLARETRIAYECGIEVRLLHEPVIVAQSDQRMALERFEYAVDSRLQLRPCPPGEQKDKHECKSRELLHSVKSRDPHPRDVVTNVTKIPGRTQP